MNPSLLPDIIKIAREAGEEIKKISLSSSDIETKSDGSPVTLADRAAHETILRGLSRLTPDIPVISEEGDLTTVSDTSPDSYWLVDPLDGTKEFIKGNGEYTVNIALIEEGTPMMGVIDVPAHNITYWAARGQSAFKSRDGEEGVAIRAKGTDQPITAVVSRSHPSPETDKFLSRLPIKNTIQRGSSVKMCAVAEGSADLYVRMNPTMLWDTSAGAIIAREAGARVVDPSGKDLLYHLTDDLKQSSFIVCTQKVYSTIFHG